MSASLRNSCGPENLVDTFGEIDIYLFDQLLKGRIDPTMKVLDAGCGGGRNLIYLLRCGCEAYGVDQSPQAIARMRQIAGKIASQLAPEHFRVEPVENLSFDSMYFDVVLSSAVLHFAHDENHWNSMVDEMWRVLKHGGILFARLASSIGIEHRVNRLGSRRYHLPDGTDRFLVDEEMLKQKTAGLGGAFLEPIKTVNVQNQRCMTTWVVRKN